MSFSEGSQRLHTANVSAEVAVEQVSRPLESLLSLMADPSAARWSRRHL
jgi:hypothetical protein